MCVFNILQIDIKCFINLVKEQTFPHVGDFNIIMDWTTIEKKNCFTFIITNNYYRHKKNYVIDNTILSHDLV